MKKFLGVLLTGCLTALLLTNCTDPTEIGLDLLDGDQIRTGFTDTITLEVTTVRGDSVQTYVPTPTFQNINYLVGNYADPIFGQVQSTIYIQSRLSRTSLFEVIEPDLEGLVTYDSAVLVLPYNETGTYGVDPTELHKLAVYELDEAIDVTEPHYSNEELATKGTVIGELTFRPSMDSVTIVNYNSSDPDTVLVAPQLRIPLSDEFGLKLLNADTSFYTRDSLFTEFLRGVAIVAPEETSGMLSFGLNPSNGGSREGGIFLYYSLRSNLDQYQFAFNEFSGRFLHFEHDYTGAVVEPFIDDAQADADTIAFVQGMEGLLTKIELPNIAELKGSVVNKAELEVYLADLDGNTTDTLPPPAQLVVYRRNADGDLLFVEDVSLTGGVSPDGRFILNAATLISAFGGTPQAASVDEPQKYTINLTTYLQRIIDGVADDNALFIAIYPRWELAARAALHGPKHPEFPMKLNVTFTKL